MGTHRATVFTRKHDRASSYIVRPSWLVEQPSWPCRKFSFGLAAFVVSFAVVAAAGGIHVVPADPPVPVPAAYVAPVAPTGCAR